MSFKEIENSRGERGHPCFTLKDGWIVADLSPSNSIIQVFEDGQHVDGHLVLTKVIPHFALVFSNKQMAPFSMKAVYSRDEPLCIFCAASLRYRRMNSGCSVLLPG
jgi:hypothetical protein